MDALKFVQLLFTGLELCIGFGFLIKAFKFASESRKIKAHRNSTYYLYWLSVVILLLHTSTELGEAWFGYLSVDIHHLFSKYLTNITFIAFLILLQMFCYKLIICYKQNEGQSIQSINRYQAKLSKVEKVLWSTAILEVFAQHCCMGMMPLFSFKYIPSDILVLICALLNLRCIQILGNCADIFHRMYKNWFWYSFYTILIVLVTIGFTCVADFNLNPKLNFAVAGPYIVFKTLQLYFLLKNVLLVQGEGVLYDRTSK